MNLVLVALADPTRRQIFELLCGQSRAVGEIAAQVPVSRPAVSQHLKVLKQAGLVLDRADGARRIYYVAPSGLVPLLNWLEQTSQQGQAVLEVELALQADLKRQEKDDLSWEHDNVLPTLKP